MSERYWITGVQIGMLKIFMVGANNELNIDKTLKEIENKQFIGNIQEPYEDYEIVIKKKRKGEK